MNKIFLDRLLEHFLVKSFGHINLWEAAYTARPMDLPAADPATRC